uniref:Putative secreted protein n=1 Tax=Anopheles marajoara TaxID=58244 RepID=A0A2M4CDC9_9DIPT
MPLFVLLSIATTNTTTTSSTNLHYPLFPLLWLLPVSCFSLLSNICDTMPFVCCIVDCDYALATVRACCFVIFSGLLQ